MGFRRLSEVLEGFGGDESDGEAAPTGSEQTPRRADDAEGDRRGGPLTAAFGKMETPFGRTYFPLLTNAWLDAPFLRTEAILWRAQESGALSPLGTGSSVLGFATAAPAASAAGRSAVMAPTVPAQPLML